MRLIVRKPRHRGETQGVRLGRPRGLRLLVEPLSKQTLGSCFNEAGFTHEPEPSSSQALSSGGAHRTTAKYITITPRPVSRYFRELGLEAS